MTLPDDVKPYRRTEVFTEATVPRGLLQTHTILSQGVYGLRRRRLAGPSQ